MWNPITLFSHNRRQEESLHVAEFTIQSNRALICNIAGATEPKDDRQLQFFDTNAQAIIESFKVIAEKDPLRAIKALLEFEKNLKPNAQASFWELMPTHIQASLKDAPADTKESAYRYIVYNAHKGQLADFMIANAESFSSLLTSSKKPLNSDFVGTFLSHAPPKTRAFLDAFQKDFIHIYERSLIDKLTLTKKLLKACNPINGRDKEITPPAFVQHMKSEQVANLILRIVDLHQNGDKNYKLTTNCLQELETLKACDSALFGKAKTPKTEKCDLYLSLYRFPLADDSNGEYLYVLASKPKGYGSPEDSGKLSTVLATTDIDMVVKAYATLNNDRAAQTALAKLTKEFGRTAMGAHTTQPQKALRPYSDDAANNYDVHYLIPSAALTPSFELTVAADSLDLGNDNHPIEVDWDILPLQQHQPSTV